jgi:cobalt-precorrin-5B (C1)-methyltransferase
MAYNAKDNANGMAKSKTELRRGWTTGACATAAAKSACHALLNGNFLDPVQIGLPRGGSASFKLDHQERSRQSALAAIEKDAGDDPDVTHGAIIQARVTWRGAPDYSAGDGKGIRFLAGDGVGTVTRPGLPIAVGEPAINPVPRAMMIAELSALAKACGIAPDLDIEISVPGGQDMAQHTMNPRLGILGGISILGTTGIVVPYSCAAWIASIHQGIDVARAEGRTHIGAATGRSSEAALKQLYAFDDSALIDMGDFAGGMLKYLRANPVERLSLAGGFAKISKLAMGNKDLHSKRSQVDFTWLGEICAPEPKIQILCETANTASQVLEAAQKLNFPLADIIAGLARNQALAMCRNAVSIEILVFNRNGELVGQNNG